MENIENHDSACRINNGNQLIDGMAWGLSLVCEVIASSRHLLRPMINVWHKLPDHFLIKPSS